MTSSPAWAAEAARQSALLRVLRRQRGGAPDWVHTPNQLQDEPDLRIKPGTVGGLGAHQAHARAVCQRALAAVCPTVLALLGDEAFGQLAWRLWGTHPPRHGDLGQWGDGLPDLLTHDGDVAQALAPWPWLADVARLDLAVHRAGRCAALPVDGAALQTLAHANPQRTRLVLQAHVQVVRSPWPLGALWRAHLRGVVTDPNPSAVDPAAELASVHALLSAGPAPADDVGAGQGWVAWWHPDGHVDVADLSPADTSWMLHGANTSAPPTLAEQLQHAHPAFDFGAWWLRALRLGWLAGTATQAQ